MQAPSLEAFFRPAADGGQRLVLHHLPPPGRALRGCVVYVHPWAEEMNKSRRMAALASRALAAAGWAVQQVDLKGCGDSSGDFGDAGWQDWRDDVAAAAAWMQQRHAGQPLWLWGLRSGALLCAEVAATLPECPNLLFWQPAAQGKALLQQFLRLKAAAQLADGGGKAILEAARAELAAGRAVDVAGYRLAPALARGLEAASLQPPPVVSAHPAPQLLWLETASQDEPALSPVGQSALPRWQAAGWQVRSQAVRGVAFWQTTEIEDVPALVTATVDGLGQAAPARAEVQHA